MKDKRKFIFCFIFVSSCLFSDFISVSAQSAGEQKKPEEITGTEENIRSGNDYFDKKDFNNAIKAFTAYIKIKPDDPVIWFKLGKAYFYTPDSLSYKEAEEAFKKVIALGTMEELVVESRYYLAKIFNHQEKYQDALKEIVIVIKSKPDNAEYHFLAAMIYKSLGMSDTAESETKISIEKDPANEEYAKFLREILKANGGRLSYGNISMSDSEDSGEKGIKGGSYSNNRSLTKRSEAPRYKNDILMERSDYKEAASACYEAVEEVHASKSFSAEEKTKPVATPVKAPASEKSMPLKAVYSSGSGLKAGYSDDNKQFNYFVDYLNKYQNVEHYPINIGERIIIKVKDLSGNSLPNAEINIFSNGNLLSSGLTYSDGSFMFFPSEYVNNFRQYSAVIKYARAEKEITFTRSGKREIEARLDYQKNVKGNVPVDILFIFDVTGSMQEEIDRLKASIELIKLNIASISSKPEVRFGMVLYRDRRDEFETKIIPLTKDMNIFQEELNKVKTAGGGDGPEDLQSALKDAVNKIDWNKDGIRLGFVITDAPPHLDYGQTYTYVSAAKDAKDKGIKIYSVGTGGLDPMGEYILRQLSQYTYAKYIFLTYGEKGESEGGMPGSVSHHTGSNYETDKLEAIIIKIAKEEISSFTDQPVNEGEDYFIASRIESEKKEETLKKLFDMAASQLLDYSTYSIEDKTPASVLSINAKETAQNTNAEYFTGQLMLSLTKNSKFKMVERKDLQTLAKELQLSLAGFTDEKNAVKVGQFIGAKILVYGEMYAKDDNFELFLKLVRVETGEILSVTKLKINSALGV